MKKLLVPIMAVALSACGGDDTKPDSAMPTATDAAAVTASVTTDAVEVIKDTSNAPEPPAVVEFIWHTETPGFTEEALVAHTEAWASIPTSSGWALNLAAVMTPRFESEDFDFLWVLAWPTQEARDAAWTDWADNHEADWRALTGGTFTYSIDHVYGFTPAPGRMASAANTSGSSVVEFLFCAYRDGMGETNRKAFETLHAGFMDNYETTAGATGYWWTVMAPLFEPSADNNFNYMWANFFSDDAERDGIYTAYEASEHSSRAEEDAECTDPAIFDSRVIYRAEA
jgi:hypothetical protein